MNQKPHSSIQLFKNPILEALTHVHPSIPFVIWIPIVFYTLYHCLSQGLVTYPMAALFFVFGVLFWTLTEYSMHRYVFHFKTQNSAGKYMVFLFHGIHHDDPQDPSRLVFPPIVSIVLGSLFFILFKAVLGFGNAEPFFAGFMSGYLVYDYIHFSVHHFRPRSSLGKFLKEHHMKHHYIAHGAKWGVSSPLWDWVFRSYS